MSDTNITPKDLAIMCETDPKTMRRFMRSMTDARVGKGGRWDIASEDVDAIIASFKARKSTGARTFKMDK